MGFGSILDLFRKDNWSNELVDMIMEMLDLGSNMFAYTIGVMVQGATDDDRQVKLYDRDIRINKLERKIRRRVVSHLSVRGSRAEVPSALIFMNVVKDAERIGDYIKNLHEVAEMMPEKADLKIYQDHLAAPAATIAELFTQTREAFLDSDEETAGKVIKKAKSEGRKNEDGIRAIHASGMDTQNAVCLVLALRFFKRVTAHMSNIASTVVMPVDLIDFYDEPEN
jgi:phosphate transport system protein